MANTQKKFYTKLGIVIFLAMVILALNATVISVYLPDYTVIWLLGGGLIAPTIADRLVK